jgi:hypothetical protein
MKSHIDKILPTKKQVDELLTDEVIEKTSEKIIESGNIKTVKDDNGNYFYMPDFSDDLSDIGFIKKCAELADGFGWDTKDGGYFRIKNPSGYYVYPTCELLNIKGGFNGKLSALEKWMLDGYPILLSKTIDKINSMYMSEESKYYISSQHSGFIIFDCNHKSYGMSNVVNNDFDLAREEILKKYFKVV